MVKVAERYEGAGGDVHRLDGDGIDTIGGFQKKNQASETKRGKKRKAERDQR
jgi:hypothetical protein